MSRNRSSRHPSRAPARPVLASSTRTTPASPARPNRRVFVLVVMVVALAALWLFTLPLRARLARETAQANTEAQQRQREEAATREKQVALSQALQAVSTHPDDPTRQLQLSSVYARQGDYPNAISAARAAERLAPASAAPHAALGDLYNRTGALDLAQDELEKAISLRPNDTAAVALLAYQELYLGWTHQAETLLRRSLASAPQNANLHATLGLVAFQEHDLATAERELLETHRLDPTDPSVYPPLFDVYQNWKKPSDAMRVIDEALMRRPDDAGLLARKAQAFLDLGDYGHAIETANQTLQVDENNTNAVYVRALAERAQGNRAAAIRDLQQVADKNPAAQTLIQLGRLYMEAGDEASGRRYLDQGQRAQAALTAVAHDIADVNARPNDPSTHLAAARSYAQVHEDARAIVELKQTLKLRPGDASAKALLKRELLAQGRADEAQNLR